MKKVFCFCIVLYFLVISFSVQAQTLRGLNWQNIGSIDNDGTIRNSYGSSIGKIDDKSGVIRNAIGSQVGKIEKDGTILNKYNSMIGKVDSDGTVRNKNYSIIGKVCSDGTIRNSFYSSIGYAKGVDSRIAAIIYFFMDLFK